MRNDMERLHLLPMLIGMMLATAPIVGQSSGQQAPAPPGAPSMLSPELVAACVDAQQQVAALADQINGRLEDARQTNNPQQMRAALADLQAALVEIRTRAAQCLALQAAAQPASALAGHAMPGAAQKPVAPGTPVVQPGSTTPAPGAPDPHAGHTMPAATAPSAAKSSARPSAKPDPHAGHAMGTQKPPAPTTRAAPKGTVDPVCGKRVDAATAPSTTYKGVTYHFCSVEDRLRFIRSPETYLKKGSGR